VVLMNWLILVVLAVVGYVIFKGFQTRHLSRCQNDSRTAENIPDAIASDNSHAEFHENAAQELQNRNESLPAPHDSPSLLYAERTSEAAATDQGVSNQHAIEQSSVDHNSNQSNVVGNNNASVTQATNAQTDSNDFSAETATLREDEVGTPANSSDYAQEERTQSDNAQISQVQPQTQSSAAPNHNASGTGYNQATISNTAASSSLDKAGIAAAGAAGVAGAVALAAGSRQDASAETHQGATQSSINHQAVSSQEDVRSAAVNSSTQNTASTQIGTANNDIDLELGDSTYNDDDQLSDHDDHDELLDFGDLTADISEMLKELNLRETDSPRLEIDSEEFAQLKTGEPGEVKPEKIENVAGKLRNMLQ